MATISQLLTAVEGLFASSVWTSNNVKAFPANYQGEINSDEWIRVSVLPFSSELAYKDIITNGQIVCQIFVPAGAGMKRAYEIVDMLKTLLDQEVISGYLQTTNSFITNIGIDTKDSGLFNVNYTVNFRSI
jgi:predicted aspartyl protease